ncbi:unnamed protein product [Rhizoctonia solani]|uniref:Peptidase C14 caspase domain-containing protein n=1 Tax=Rhizoctonia solani TaxID=456999 RepID=A0A8H3CYU4_9AGAM|nr:unnamed protein product [Rhizoctonia solani]
MGKTTVGAGHPTCARSSVASLNLTISNSQQPANAIDLGTAPLSPEDEVFYDALEEFPDENFEEVFYDALEDFYEEGIESQSLDIPSSTEPVQTSNVNEPKDARKERLVAHIGTNNGALNASATNRGPCRGSSKPAALSAAPQKTSMPLDACACSVPVPRSPRKKAVLIGLNYERCGKKDFRLNQAIQDAQRFANTLTKLEYSSENMKVVTDEENQPFPSYRYLMECIDWLVQDASKGDRLFFMFSGHCQPSTIGKPEPYLVAADLMPIPRSTFQERLIAKVPAGAELTIVLDCCNAAGMVKLQYCVRRMDYKREIKQMNKSEALSELEKPVISDIRKVPQHGSLHGLDNVVQQASPAPNQATQAIINHASFNSPPNAMKPRRLNLSVFAGQPLLPEIPPSTGPSTDFTASLARGISQNTGSSSPVSIKKYNPGYGRRLVVEGLSPTTYFAERRDEFVSPAGKVLVWAGTGYPQKAFESTNSKNSIVTDAMCNVLETCPDSPVMVTQRHVWDSLVGAIDKENNLRDQRDAKKFRRPPPNLRIQCAELWVSQEEPLRSPSPILDQPVHRRLWTEPHEDICRPVTP